MHQVVINHLISKKGIVSTIVLLFVLSLNSAYAYTEPQAKASKQKSILDERDKSNSKATSNPFSISQYRQNYLLPFTYVSDPNPLDAKGLNQKNIDNIEAKYQLSIKLPIYLTEQNNSGLYFGFTATSFWQVYNSEGSKPFRETNYEPEVFYSWKNQLSFMGFKFNQLVLGASHQSNGRSGLQSRGWNRLYAAAIFSDESFFYHIKAWYRLEESKKEDPFDSTGDDNPDITRYLGYGEIGIGTEINNINMMALIRNNLRTSDNKGSVELNFSYPINERYEVLLQYFNGYGDSLIDYNRHQQRIGLGIQLTFL
ncbi:phospholipase A [Thalassotalea sediminis]|uniref:phospholipase A n=1 Tax=Thalassotalea sediminis TaxID=1759089 RepID=UPI00257362E3|nr:phospholipase A [Thalassotalea sediminis]